MPLAAGESFWDGARVEELGVREARVLKRSPGRRQGASVASAAPVQDWPEWSSELASARQHHRQQSLAPGIGREGHQI